MVKLSNDLIDLRSKRFFGTALAESLPEDTIFTIKGTRHEILKGQNDKEELTLILSFEPDEHGPWPELPLNGIRKDNLKSLFGTLNDDVIVGKEIRLTTGKAMARNRIEYYVVLIEGV